MLENPMDDIVRDCVYCQGGYHERSAHMLTREQLDKFIADAKAGIFPDKHANGNRNY
jgi:hypothetical protein